MAINIQLKDFTAKPAPVPADIVYIGNSTDSFNEVQSTIAQVIAAYPILLSLGNLTTLANQYIYTTGVDTFATASLTSVPTANLLAAWDANKNLSANSMIQGFLATATAAGTTTLTVASAGIQQFTGTLTQTVTMPVVSTLVAGQQYTIINSSSGTVTVNSSGGNLVQTVVAGASVLVTCVLNSGTTAASWETSYNVGVFPLSIPNGGTGVSSVTTSPTASAFAGWDANSNLSANSFISGFATQATAGGTTVLTVASKEIQEFTGTLTQTVTMPVVSTLVAGQQYTIINNSSGAVTVNSSGGNAIQVMAANTTLYIDCILNSGTTAASWNAGYLFDNGAGVLSITGTANQVIASASTGAVVLSLPQSIGTASTPTFAGLNLTNPYIAGAGGLHSFQIFTSGTAATYTKPANVTSILIELVGGGGAGGGATGNTGTVSAGGGGGGGGYARLYVASASGTYTYTVGAGGTAGTAGNNPGNNGGTTTFSASSLQATGGTGGGGMGAPIATTAANSAGGAGGIGSNGDLNIKGDGGTQGFSALGATNGAIMPGTGGSSHFGGGATGFTQTGGNYGGGGSGAVATTSSTAGGTGAAGLIVVWEFA